MARLESTKRAKLKTAKQHQPSQKSKSLTCCYLLPRFWVTPYLVPIGTVDLKKKMFPSTSYSFLFQIKAVAGCFQKIVVPPKWMVKIMGKRRFENALFFNGSFGGVPPHRLRKQPYAECEVEEETKPMGFPNSPWSWYVISSLNFSVKIRTNGETRMPW